MDTEHSASPTRRATSPAGTHGSPRVATRTRPPPRPPPHRRVATVTEPAREIPVHEETDVLVVGGGPAGTAAAVAARRLGQRVTRRRALRRPRWPLGGRSRDLDRPDDRLVRAPRSSRASASELLDRLPAGRRRGTRSRAVGLDRTREVAYWRERLSAFRDTVCKSPMIDPEWLKIASHEMLVGAGVRVLLHSWVVAAITVRPEPEIQSAARSSRASRGAGRSSPRSSWTPPATSTSSRRPAARSSPTPRRTARAATSSTAINTAFTWSGVDFAPLAGVQAAATRGPPRVHGAWRRGAWLRRDAARRLARRRRRVHGPAPDRLQRARRRAPQRRRARVASPDGRPPRLLPHNAPGFESAWIMLAAPQIGHPDDAPARGPAPDDDWRLERRGTPRDEVGVSPSPVTEDRRRSPCPTARSSPSGSTASSSAAATWPATPRRRRSCARSRSAG